MGVKTLLLFVAALVPVAAQMPPVILPVSGGSPNIVQYLELTPAQMARMTIIQADFAKWQAVRTERTFQVNAELAVETQKSPIDPMALGLRYAELETIRREVAEEETKVMARMRDVLNDAQKAKLKTLEDAAKLLPLVNQAECYYLLAPQPVLVGAIISVTGAFDRTDGTRLGAPARVCPARMFGQFGSPLANSPSGR